MIRRWLTKVKALLMQGSDPVSLAWSVSLGAVLGIFPILGSATLLCAAVGLTFKLNHAVLQGANYAVYPVQIPAVLLFVSLGDSIFGHTSLTLAPAALVQAVQSDPLGFAVTFARAGLHAVTAWLMIAPVLVAILFFPFRKLFSTLARQGAVYVDPTLD